MALKPIDWSVVTAGRWNRAILTPAGIQQRIFECPEGGALEVLVPIDLLAPPRVKMENVTVVANWDRLIVQPDPGYCSFEQLDRARQLCVNALESLPETPLSAVGYNVVYRSGEPMKGLRNVLGSELDESFFDADYSFDGRTVVRVIPWREGTINFSIEENADEDEYTVRFNFERKSVERDHHLAWLRIPIADVQQQVHTILTRCLHIAEGEIDDIAGNDPGNE